MLRFPNPGSDISSFVRIFCGLYEVLQEQESFGLDDMSRVMIERNLATSCGYMGDTALARSTREDRSRDPLYNQSKMYSELYKILGWINPTAESALHFRFTYLGAHVVLAQRDPRAIVKECLLGIVYPNQIISVVGSYSQRPFATLLKSISQLDGFISREEMIVGPLCLEDDRDGQRFSEMIVQLRGLRGSARRLEVRLRDLARTRRITLNTMQNYTRFPIGVLKWTGWARRESKANVYGRSAQFLVLTEEGVAALANLERLRDFRASELNGRDGQTTSAVIRLGVFGMLERAGFDITPMGQTIEEDKRSAAALLDDGVAHLLFSPFQELKPDMVRALFVEPGGSAQRPDQALTTVGPIQPQAAEAHETHRVSLLPGRGGHQRAEDNQAEKIIVEAMASAGNLNVAIETIVKRLKGLNKERFYPLVADLFKALGYNCQVSRAGVHYQRFDAMIIDPENSIPIEIKSPGEEEFISVKAVRQALENKVILLSRRPYPTNLETTTLVVGYYLPNDRSEVSSLVDNIHTAFNISVGVIDIRALLKLVGSRVVEGMRHDTESFKTLRGIIDVAEA